MTAPIRRSRRTMNGAELKKRLEPILGYGWQTKTAKALYGGQSRTVRRMVADDVKVQPYVEAAVELLEIVHAAGLPIPKRWGTAEEPEPAKAKKR